MEFLTQQLINGLAVGCIYGLVALGYTLVFGVLRMINFAHAELFMLGPMITLFLMRGVGVLRPVPGTLGQTTAPLNALELALVILVNFVAAGLFSGAVSATVERTVYRRLRRAPSFALLVSAMAVGLFISNATMIVAGRNIKGFPRLLPIRYMQIGSSILSNFHIFVAVVTTLLLVGLLYLVNRTYLGRAIRAVGENRDTAALMGVNVNRTIAWVFFIGGALGAASGVMFSMSYQQVYFYMGSLVGTRAWTAAIIGGIGNIMGAFVGGLLLGMLETIGAGYLPIITGGRIGAEYTSVFAFILLILMLIFRPQGIFGEPVKD